MRKIATALLAAGLASIAHAHPEDKDPTTTEPQTYVCPDGTVVYSLEDCPHARIEVPDGTPYPKPHIGWDEGPPR